MLETRFLQRFAGNLRNEIPKKGQFLKRSVKCVTVVKNKGAMGGVKIARSHLDQFCFAASIGEVRNCRQKWVVLKSLGRTSINRVSLLRSVKCVSVVKK